jgi:hypothetical protein
MIYILYAYLTISTVTALWVLWVRFVQIDPDDDDYDGRDWWIQAIFVALLWPLLPIFASPRDLFRGKERFLKSNFALIDVNKSYKQRLLDLETIVESPPPCGKTVIYRHPHFLESGIEYTAVSFQAADIAKHFRGEHLPLYTELERQAVAAWIQKRDETITEPTLIPESINFKNMAFALIKHGFGEIQCRECDAWYPAGLMIHHRPELHAGMNTETYRCPLGHALLDNDWAHLYVRAKET